MFEQFSHIIDKISIPHLNTLLLLGLALLGGAVGGRFFQKLRIPQVVGYIAIGILIGESGLKIIDHETVQGLQPFNYFALGLIGFMIGGELKREVIMKHGKSFVNILLCEGLTAFVAVTAIVGVVGGVLIGDWRISWALGLLLGAIASATAPAATTEVLREYKTRGPLTRTVLGIVALDDGLALILFAIASSLAGMLSGNVDKSGWRVFVNPIYEIGVSILIGVAAGFILNKLLKKYSEEPRLLAFTIGTVLLTTGFALAIHVDMLLAAMTLGVVAVNFAPRKSKDIFKMVEGFTPPIYVIFFVLVGAKLNIGHMTPIIMALAIAYIIARSAGKAIGANVGSRISGAPKTVQKYLPLCLFSQAGVAIGLSILASHYFAGAIGDAIVIIVTATAFVLEMIGPACVKVAVTKAGEVGLNITEDDLAEKTKVDEVMDKKPVLIYENMPLAGILKAFSQSASLYYPVVSKDMTLRGIITVDSIKQTFMDTDLGGLIVAHDLMVPVIAKVSSDQPMLEAKELFDRYHLECLPVVTDGDKIKGFIERRMFTKYISTKIIELQRHADSLEDA